MSARDGGAAFPQSLAQEGPFGGMTLRDWFAGQALAGIIARQTRSEYEGSVNSHDWSCEAGDAYALADAMIAERAKENGDD